jgi:4-diphosphocytidyl-2-C-methyl-D-erythritol kinase
MATRVRSYSKINLGLAIGPVRADGFHGLATLYQTLALHDVVTVEARLAPGSGFEVRGSSENGERADAEQPDLAQSRISLTTNHAQVPTDGRNTAWKMVELALKRLGVAAEVSIHIEKELPVQGGLGAGSANAAAALIGLERELGLEVPGRLEIAAEVGSDVPLFLIGGAVMGEGRGELVTAMPDLPATWCVVAVSEVGVSTPRAFQEWDERQGKGNMEQREEGPGLKPPIFEPGYRGLKPVADREGPIASGAEVSRQPPAGRLTSCVEPDRLEELSHAYASVLGFRPAAELAPDTSGIVRGPDRGNSRNDLAENILLALVRTGIENDFEQVVFPQYPLLREIKHELMGTSTGLSSMDDPADASGNAIYAALSGSGSALFGLYRTEADAKAAQRRVQATGCKAILTETLPRQEYWRRMFAE